MLKRLGVVLGTLGVYLGLVWVSRAFSPALGWYGAIVGPLGIMAIAALILLFLYGIVHWIVKG